MHWLRRLWNRWQLRSIRTMAIALPEPFMVVDMKNPWIYHSDHLFTLNVPFSKEVEGIYQWIMLRLSEDHRSMSIVGIVEPVSFLRRRHVHLLKDVLNTLREDVGNIQSTSDVLRVDFYSYRDGPYYSFSSLTPVGSLDHEGYTMVHRVVLSRSKGVLLFKTGD
jgi:hypothetical protein